MINIIAAMSENHVIANTKLDNQFKIPWHIPDDFKRFKKLTTGNPVIMGRKTFDTFDKPLPSRKNIIVTRNLPNPLDFFDKYKGEDVVFVRSLDVALSQWGNKEIFIIGGGEIYRQAIPFADKIYLTIIEGQFEGDVFFPDYSEFKNQVVIGEGEQNGFEYKFLELTK
jgi:dihydrofolate reductase